MYELFEYIPGQSYPQTLESTFDSGRVLGLYHKLLENFTSEWTPPTGSYHMAPSVEHGPAVDPHDRRSAPMAEQNIEPMLDFLLRAIPPGRRDGRMPGHGQLAQADRACGLASGEHAVSRESRRRGDRLRFGTAAAADGRHRQRRIAVLDHRRRRGRRKWPDYVDESRFKRFLRGYDEVMLLSQAEIRAIPWLMIEALIAEAVFPIAATGNVRPHGRPGVLADGAAESRMDATQRAASGGVGRRMRRAMKFNSLLCTRTIFLLMLIAGGFIS